MTGNSHRQTHREFVESEQDGARIGKRTANAIPFAQRLSCTIPEACVATGLGRTKLYELIGAGCVDTTLIGRRRLVSVQSLLYLLGREPGAQIPK